MSIQKLLEFMIQDDFYKPWQQSFSWLSRGRARAKKENDEFVFAVAYMEGKMQFPIRLTSIDPQTI